MPFSRRSFFGLLAAAPAVAVAAPAIAKALPASNPVFPDTESIPGNRGLMENFVISKDVEPLTPDEIHRIRYALTTGRGWFEFEPWSTALGVNAENRVIHRAMRLLGVIRAGETLSRNDYGAAELALDTLLKDWFENKRNRPTEREITYGLAIDLAPEYGFGKRQYAARTRPL